MMFDETEWKQMIESVMRITESGFGPWKQGIGDEFTLGVRKFEFRVGSVDGDARPPFYFRVRDDSQFADLDRLESAPADEDVPVGAWTAAQLIPRLYTTALRSASGGPAKFKELMEVLDPLDPEGSPPF